MIKRTFLVTGASKGIGRAISERLVREGHTVVGIARQQSDFPGILVAANLDNEHETREALAEISGRHSIDGVINNVGVVRPKRLEEQTIADLNAVLSLNLNSALLASQAALPNMRAKAWGRIINISSLTILGITERTAYAAAKAALVSFARTWALELATTGITVNAVAPGPTETELFRANNPPGSDGEARYLAGVPMRRFGKPEEIAAAIGFLLSDEASFITGQTLFVDGGASIGKAGL
jgi:NAD(P)-dependent dehydrogenase (short-subunit alcohol dehydrogenase family)